MPDVGVLNLTIHDNSDEAGKGLERLAGALTAVKTAKQSFSLTKVGTELTNLKNIISGTKGTEALVSKLGTMFNAINKFSQLKDFGIDAEKLRDTALYMNKIADGMDRVNESRRASVSGGGAHDLYGQMVQDANTVKDVLDRTADSVEKSSRRIFNIQLFGGKGTKDIGSDIGASIPDLQKQANDFVEVQSKIVSATESATSTSNSAMEHTKSAIEATTEAQIKLNDAGKAYAGTVTVFDDAEKVYKQMYIDTSVMGEALKNAIDLTQVPSSGRNGVFANVAEEVEYLKQKIDEEVVSQKQWISINEAATNQLKYGGGSKNKSELEFDKKYSEEGYYAALEAEQRYKDALVELSGYMNEYIANAKQATQESNAQAESMQNVANATKNASDAMASVSGAVQNANMMTPMVQNQEIAQRTPWTAEDVSNLVNYYSQVELLEMKMQGMQSALAADIEANKLDTQQIADKTIAIQNLKAKIEELKHEESGAKETTVGLRDALDGLFGIAKKGTLGKLVSQFARMAKMRAIRYVIRQIAQGFREGVQNVYEYSKAIGSSFAPSMDSAASSLVQMKNSIGAAAAPAIQALIPVLQTLVNWFITGINYVNQFFALLNGQRTWTRALPATTTAFKKQEKAAKGASAAMKDLLADWDELNIIQSQTNGGSGGGSAKAAEDYLSMFEEVSRFDNKVKDIVNWVKDNFNTIKDVAIAIGAAMLAWKVAGAIYDVLKLVGTLKGGIIMSVVGFTLSSMAGASLANNGWTTETILKTVGGLAASALGGSWIGASAASALGLTAAGGAVVGAIAGLAIGVGFMIHSFEVKTIENAYGTIEEDADTIRANVLKYFNPEAEALITVSNARLKDEEDAVKKVGDALAALNKDYPVAVSVHTKEALDQLKLDVNNLVLETKNLILQRKQNTRSLVLNSKQFDDAESFIKFSDLQWDATAKYIEGLGKQMGELISNGITDGADLDGLQQKLTGIVRAVTYGQRSGEYAGKVSLAGANLREAGYTKDTISNYISTFLNERKTYENQATADALAQQAELKALWASLEERFNQGDKTVTKADVENAKKHYEAFDIKAEVDRLMGMYLGEGDKLFAKDLFEGLSIVMDKTKGLFTVSEMRKHIEQYASNDLNQDAEKYVSDLKEQLIKTISESTGQDVSMLTQLFDMTGINPLDLFDTDFAGKVRDAIAEELYKGYFTQEEKDKIAEAFGLGDILSESVHKKTVDELKQKIMEYMKGNSNQDDIAAFLLGLNDNYINAYVDEALEAVEKELEHAEAMKALDNPKSTLMRDIEGGLTNNEISNVMGRFNISMDDINKILAEIGYTHSQVEGPLAKPYEGGSESPNFVNKNGEQLTEQDLADGVATGTERATREQVQALANIQRAMEILSKREWTINISPSAVWGFFNQRSNNAAEAVTGNGP